MTQLELPFLSIDDVLKGLSDDWQHHLKSWAPETIRLDLLSNDEPCGPENAWEAAVRYARKGGKCP